MKVMFCPKCEGTEVEFEAGGITGRYVCKKCGFVGNLFPEKEVEK